MKNIIDVLKKTYPLNGHFSFDQNGDLKKKCNAPKDNNAGVYIMFNKKGIIYIGRSGKIKDGKISYRSGGIYDRIVDGKENKKTLKIVVNLCLKK
jgi:hypothetical protein